jgi:beta-glucanase (GH16 family)
LGAVIVKILSGCVAVSQTEKKEITTAEKSAVPPDYVLAWNDEFDGDSLDREKWGYHWLGKRKLGYSTEESVSLSGGTLKLRLYKDQDKYCYGMIDTRGKYAAKYGYFETRAKLPKIKGPQSAFWLLSEKYGSIIGDPGSSGVEIDIMEYVKTSPGKVHFTIHWDGYKDKHKKNGYSFDHPSVEDGDWHTYGLLWTPDSYKFYVDGIFAHEKKVPISHIPEYILLSNEIGQWGGGDKIAEEKLPDQFEVDYVRVYQLPELSGLKNGESPEPLN